MRYVIDSDVWLVRTSYTTFGVRRSDSILQMLWDQKPLVYTGAKLDVNLNVLGAGAMCFPRVTCSSVPSFLCAGAVPLGGTGAAELQQGELPTCLSSMLHTLQCHCSGDKPTSPRSFQIHCWIYLSQSQSSFPCSCL